MSQHMMDNKACRDLSGWLQDAGYEEAYKNLSITIHFIHNMS